MKCFAGRQEGCASAAATAAPLRVCSCGSQKLMGRLRQRGGQGKTKKHVGDATLRRRSTARDLYRLFNPHSKTNKPKTIFSASAVA